MAKIFDKPSNKWIEIPNETYAEYMKYCSNHRKRMQAHGLCKCPRAKWWQCDTVCADCIHQNLPETVSLDEPVTDCSSEDEMELLDVVVDGSELMEELLCDADELNHLLKRLQELMPEALKIGKLRDDELTDTEIAERIGVCRTTFRSRLNKVREILKKEFPEVF